MCTAILGDKLDIHSGGIDLKFPHHDNERELCPPSSSYLVQVFLFTHLETLEPVLTLGDTSRTNGSVLL